MHFNIFERSNIFNIFLTFSIQILTFPFNNFFSRFQKKEVLPSSIIFIDNHGQIMGRSWADHGRSIHAKKSWKFQLFPIPFFSEKLWKFAIFPLALNKAFSYFCRPRTCFLGKNCLFSESKINFTPWNRVLLSERSILHLENAMFSKIRPYFLRTFCMGDRFMQKILKISAFSDTVFSRKSMQMCDFPSKNEQSVKLFLQTPLVFIFLLFLLQL